MRVGTKVAIRWAATIALIGVLLGLALVALLIEMLLLSFAPNPLAIMLLPVLLLTASIAVWQMIGALHRWAPRATPRRASRPTCRPSW